MSYLICLYVYYHGNNLSRYGINKGSQEIEEPNRGLTYKDIDYKGLIPQRELDIMKKQEAVRKENDYEEVLRRAILDAQRESIALSRKGLVHNATLDNTASDILDEAYDRSGTIDLSLFNTLNGF